MKMSTTDLPDADFAAVYYDTKPRNGRTSRKKIRKYPLHSAEHVEHAVKNFGKDTTIPDYLRRMGENRIKQAAARHKKGAGVD